MTDINRREEIKRKKMFFVNRQHQEKLWIYCWVHDAETIPAYFPITPSVTSGVVSTLGSLQQGVFDFVTEMGSWQRGRVNNEVVTTVGWRHYKIFTPVCSWGPDINGIFIPMGLWYIYQSFWTNLIAPEKGVRNLIRNTGNFFLFRQALYPENPTHLWPWEPTGKYCSSKFVNYICINYSHKWAYLLRTGAGRNEFHKKYLIRHNVVSSGWCSDVHQI